jgi:LPS O-antigen subunit length determinant protein (WzzB/FepE family)
LYPPAWRNRYGAEFCALLEDVGPGWRDFWDVLRGALAMQMNLVWSFRNVIVVCGLAGAMVAAIGAFQMDNRYVSDAVLKLTAAAGAKVDDGVMAKKLQRLMESSLTRGSLADIIQNKRLDLYKRERQYMPLEDIVQSMKRDIRVERIRPAGEDLSNVFQIQFKYADPVIAQAVTRELAEHLIDSNLAQAEAAPLDRPHVVLQVLDPANLPQRPVFPNRPLIAALGLIGGLALGAIVMGVRRWRLS